jgi:hypothetical protein
MPRPVNRVFVILCTAILSIACESAFANDVTLSCSVDEAAPKHGRLNWEIRFDQRNQLVYIGANVITAAITDARIDFRVDLGTGLPMTFAIDRATGAIGVTGSRGILYNGQCKVVDPSQRSH